MIPITVKLQRPDALQVNADEPCLLKIHVPITLPHRLDPSMPAPPYHEGTVSAHNFRHHHALPVFKELMAHTLSHLVGGEHTVDIANLEFEVETKSSDQFRLFGSWEADAAFDKENGFDAEAGYWKDEHGKDNYEMIEAYEEVFDWIIIYHEVVLLLVCGKGSAKSWKEMNPRVLRLDVVGDESASSGGVVRGESREIVFQVREYTEGSRRRENEEVAMDMADWDEPETQH